MWFHLSFNLTADDGAHLGGMPHLGGAALTRRNYFSEDGIHPNERGGIRLS